MQTISLLLIMRSMLLYYVFINHLMESTFSYSASQHDPVLFANLCAVDTMNMTDKERGQIYSSSFYPQQLLW